MAPLPSSHVSISTPIAVLLHEEDWKRGRKVWNPAALVREALSTGEILCQTTKHEKNYLTCSTRKRSIRAGARPAPTASPDNYSSEKDKEKLRDIQETTRHTQQSYHEKYKTAQAVRDNFRDDLRSEAAKKVHCELQHLGLPTINDIKDEFEKLADELGVGH